MTLYLEKYRLLQNDILFSHINSDSHLGKTALYKLKDKVVIHGINLLLIRTNEKIKAEFLYYLFNHYRTKGKFLKIAQHAVNQSSINQKKLKDLDIPLPPLPVQHKIVAKIEELFSELDSGVANLRKAKEQIKTYRQSVLAYAFSGKLTNAHPELDSGSKKLKQVQLDNSQLPPGWKWVKLGEVTKTGTGLTPLRSKKEYYINGKIPWLTSSVVNENFVYSSTEFVTERALEVYRLKKYPQHTLLVALYGEGKTRGKCTELMFESTINQAMAAIVFNEEFFPSLKYVKWFLIKNYEDMRKLSSGGVQPNLNLSLVKNTEIPFAPLMDQHQIVSEIERRFSVADKLEQTIDMSLKQAETLKQSILKKAFEGKLIKEEKNECELNTFELMQIVGAVINNLEKYNIYKGEMIIAKYIYLLQKLYKIKIGFEYQRMHFGPYSLKLKKILATSKGPFQLVGKRKRGYYTIKRKDQLLKYYNISVDRINQEFPKLIELFKRYKNAEQRDHKIELLATAAKLIEDYNTLDVELIYQGMKKWKTDKSITGFSNKAEKFNKEETIKCVSFIKKNNWDVNLLKQHVG